MKIIDKNYKGLIDKGWEYEIKGDVIINGSVEINLDNDLHITGSFKSAGNINMLKYSLRVNKDIEALAINVFGKLESLKSIKSETYIKTGGGIKAGERIEAGWSVSSFGDIKAINYIKAKSFILSGGEIEVIAGHISANKILALREVNASDYIKVVSGLLLTEKVNHKQLINY